MTTRRPAPMTHLPQNMGWYNNPQHEQPAMEVNMLAANNNHIQTFERNTGCICYAPTTGLSSQQ